MMQHHIKFGYKRFYSSEYTVQMHAQSVKCSTVPVTLTLNISIQSFHNTPQLVRCDSKWSLVAKKDQQSIRYSRDNPILITATITVTLILKRSNQSFLMTLWLWMMYHHIRSGHKIYQRISSKHTHTHQHSNSEMLPKLCHGGYEHNLQVKALPRWTVAPPDGSIKDGTHFAKDIMWCIEWGQGEG